MTPYYYSGSEVRVWSVGSGSYLYNDYVAYFNGGVRPVINLKPSKLIIGTGTFSDPYIVL